MTIPEFREHYETKHRLIGEKYLKGYVTKYMRRFVDPLPDRKGEQDPEVIEKILKHLGLDEASQVKNRSPPVGLFGHSGQLF